LKNEEVFEDMLKILVLKPIGSSATSLAGKKGEIGIPTWEKRSLDNTRRVGKDGKSSISVHKKGGE